MSMTDRFIATLRRYGQTLFGMAKIAGDSQVRAKLDPIEPTHFYPIACPRGGAREFSHLVAISSQVSYLGGSGKNAPCRAGR